MKGSESAVTQVGRVPAQPVLAGMPRLLSALYSRRHHASNLFSQFLCRIVALTLFALALPYFAKYQSAVNYGGLSLLLAAFSALGMLDLGISYAVGIRFGRAAARKNARSIGVIRYAIPATIVLAVIAGLGIFSGARVISNFAFGTDAQLNALRIFAGCVSLLVVSATFAAVVQASNRVDWFNYSRLILDVGKAAALLISARSEQPLATAMWVLLVATGLKCLADAVLARKLVGDGRAIHPSWSARQTRVNLGLGIPMTLASAGNMVLATGDRVLVSRLFGADALAHYSLAADICSKAYVLVWAVTGTMYPLLIRRSATGGDVRKLMRLNFWSVLVVALFVYLPLALFARPLLEWWLGGQLGADSAPFVIGWVMIATIYLTGTVVYSGVQASGRSSALALGNALAIVVMAVGAWTIYGTGIRHLGALTVVALMALAYTAQAICVYTLTRQQVWERIGRR